MGTIVCAVDESHGAAAALRVAVEIGRSVGLRLVVVHVEDIVGAGSAVRESAGQRGRELLERVLAAGGVNGATDRRVEVGEPASELARVAAEEAATLIVLGSRTRRCGRHTRISRLASDLAATTDCPVVIVPPTTG